VRDYLFSLPKEVKGFLAVETHTSNSLVESLCFRKGFTVACNEPQPSEGGGTHGGELIAMRSKYHARQINPDILNSISNHYGILRFASMIINIKGVELLLITLYLWHTEGFTERNHVILYQIQYLKVLLGLPAFIIGDFNITFEKFKESGWCERLNVRMLHPGADSTTCKSTNRAIDFSLISLEIDPMFRDSTPILSVPWHPHVGLLIGFNGNPRSIIGNVQCIPKKLPLGEFSIEWKTMAFVEQQKKWIHSIKRAKMY